MSRIFYRKRFSDYLGEQRAIDDIVQFYIPDGGVTPTPTPVPVTPTPTPSITPTRTLTPTPTPSITPTRTLTPTPTKTGTPTPTPTRTPAPACDITYTELPSPTPSVTPTITPTPTPSSGPSFDPDAAAYLAAVLASGGTLNATISAATDTLFVQLKGASLYNKISLMYPYIGAVSGSCSIEAKNPASNPISFLGGGWTFTSGGTIPNKSQSYATNNWAANTNIASLNDVSFWTYLGATTQGTFEAYSVELGFNFYNAVNPLTGLIGGAEITTDQSSYFYSGGSQNVGVGVIPAGTGFIGWNRSSNIVFNLWRNGTKLQTNTTPSSGSLPSDNLHMPLQPINTPGTNQGSGRIHRMDMVCLGLTDGEAANLSTIINTFQTTLGRNTY